MRIACAFERQIYNRLWLAMIAEAVIGAGSSAGGWSGAHRLLSDRCSKSDSSIFARRTLRGHGAGCERDASPLVLPRSGARQMQHDALHRALDAGSELQEPLTQGRYLRPGEAGARGTAPQLLHQHVGMASLETRVPMLDHRVFEFAWRMPIRMEVRDGEGKWLLRRLLYWHVPRHLVERSKMGLPCPWTHGCVAGCAIGLNICSASRGCSPRVTSMQELSAVAGTNIVTGRRNWQSVMERVDVRGMARGQAMRTLIP